MPYCIQIQYIFLYCLWWKNKQTNRFIWILKPCTFFCQLSTVAPCEWEESRLLRVQCGALKSFPPHFPFTIRISSALLKFFNIYIFFFHLYLIQSLYLLIFYFYLLYHRINRLLCIPPRSATWRCIAVFVFHPQRDELISMKACILAYLWLPLHHVGECYIANRKF